MKDWPIMYINRKDVNDLRTHPGFCHPNKSPHSFVYPANYLGFSTKHELIYCLRDDSPCQTEYYNLLKSEVIEIKSKLGWQIDCLWEAYNELRDKVKNLEENK